MAISVCESPLIYGDNPNVNDKAHLHLMNTCPFLPESDDQATNDAKFQTAVVLVVSPAPKYGGFLRNN